MTTIGDTAGLHGPLTNFMSLCFQKYLVLEAVCVLQKTLMLRSHFHYLDLCNITPVVPAEVQILMQ